MRVSIAIFAIIAIVSADDLKFVSIVYRHGDRAPGMVYPTDPNPPSLWPNGLAQLTNLGKQHTYELGGFLRDRYDGFLPAIYHEEDIHIMSSDISRALMSAYCVLAGLYEPQGEDVWMDTMHWQPIPVHSVPLEMDNLMYNNASCPKFEQLLIDHVFVGNSETIDKYMGILKEVTKMAGLPMPDNPFAGLLLGLGLYDCLFVEEKYGYELPEWTKKFYPEQLREIAKFVYTMSNSDTELKRFRCGPLLKDVIQHAEYVVQGTSKVKMWQYSAHDGTIVGLLQCMNVFDGELVPFTSAVIFELYQRENDFEIEIYYKKNDEMKALEIPGCKSPCSFDSFKQSVQDVIPGNWQEECQL